METSVLVTIKQMLGLERDYNVFDQDILVSINAALSTLKQVGAMPESHRIVSASDTWESLDFSDWQLELVKEYLYIKTRLVFDLPSNGQVISAFTERAKELEWRLHVGDGAVGG